MHDAWYLGPHQVAGARYCPLVVAALFSDEYALTYDTGASRSVNLFTHMQLQCAACDHLAAS